jgi:uncharacterized membrane protein
MRFCRSSLLAFSGMRKQLGARPLAVWIPWPSAPHRELNNPALPARRRMYGAPYLSSTSRSGVLSLVHRSRVATAASPAQESGPSPSEVSYTFTPFTVPFSDSDQTLVGGINDLGQIVGSYHDSGGFHGFVSNRWGVASIDVPFAGASETDADGINLQSEISGHYQTSEIIHGFVLRHGSFTALDVPFTGVTATFPGGINSQSEVVGTYDDGSGSHGFILNRGMITAIDVPFTGAYDTVASGINSWGQIVGSYTSADDHIHGYAEYRGTFTSLDVPFAGVTETQANGINDRGEIVGFYNDAGGGHGFILERGTFIPLNAAFSNIHDVTFTNVSSINDLGQIVGTYSAESGGDLASFFAQPSYSFGAAHAPALR